jgi:uncharacterized membrane protein YdfJ with MMPL/SSD domain
MMIFLFRSPLWGVCAVLPLSITILFIYGMIGLFGKDYDMPVAVLSSLTLGISVDFAIHFLERTKMMYRQYGTWEDSVKGLFEEPARAISRNAIVIAIGFLPLLLAPLVPYKTVGFFLSAIMVTSSLATFFVLPASITLTKNVFFKKIQAPGCNCLNCIILTMLIAGGVVYSLHGFSFIGIGGSTVIALVIVVVAALVCNRLSRRERCSIEEKGE